MNQLSTSEPISVTKSRDSHTMPADLSALAALARSSVAELRFLRVDESDEQICLSGHVRSFYHKQLAQETIRPLAAGRRVINEVRVERPSDFNGSGPTAAR